MDFWITFSFTLIKRNWTKIPFNQPRLIEKKGIFKSIYKQNITLRLKTTPSYNSNRHTSKIWEGTKTFGFINGSKDHSEVWGREMVLRQFGSKRIGKEGKSRLPEGQKSLLSSVVSVWRRIVFLSLVGSIETGRTGQYWFLNKRKERFRLSVKTQNLDQG